MTSASCTAVEAASRAGAALGEAGMTSASCTAEDAAEGPMDCWGGTLQWTVSQPPHSPLYLKLGQ